MLEDLLKEVLSGAQAQQGRNQQPAQTDIMSEIIKGVLGGGAAQQARPAAGQPDLGGMADLLGGILGAVGGGTTRGGGVGGRGGSMGANNPIVGMVANLLAERLGISPTMARTVVSFALALLMGKATQGQVRSGSQKSASPLPGGQEFDLDDLLEGDYAWESGLAGRLASQTGTSEDEAAYQLQEAVLMLTQHPAAKSKKKKRKTQPAAAPAKSGLDSLLDTWQVD